MPNAHVYAAAGRTYTNHYNTAQAALYLGISRASVVQAIARASIEAVYTRRWGYLIAYRELLRYRRARRAGQVPLKRRPLWVDETYGCLPDRRDRGTAPGVGSARPVLSVIG